MNDALALTFARGAAPRRGEGGAAPRRGEGGEGGERGAALGTLSKALAPRKRPRRESATLAGRFAAAAGREGAQTGEIVLWSSPATWRLDGGVTKRS